MALATRDDMTQAYSSFRKSEALEESGRFAKMAENAHRNGNPTAAREYEKHAAQLARFAERSDSVSVEKLDAAAARIDRLGERLDAAERREAATKRFTVYCKYGGHQEDFRAIAASSEAEAIEKAKAKATSEQRRWGSFFV